MTELKEKSKSIEEVHFEKRYKVIMYNDDITPFDYVVAILMTVFSFDEEKAKATTLKIHNTGSSVVEVTDRQTAETHIAIVDQINAETNHYLQTEIELDSIGG